MKITSKEVIMSFRKTTRFVAALLLGLVLTLSSYPVHSQEFPSFENCYQEVKNYPRKRNLNRYSERQVYCLVVIELIDGGVDVDKEYYTAELFGVIMNALRDKDDAKDSNRLDNKLSYKQITKRFPGNRLNQLINESLDEAVNEFSLSQSFPLQVAATKIPSNTSPSSSVLAYKTRKTKGKIGVDRLATKVSKGHTIAFLTR
ncbi:MAG TPA: hypothetical protein V6D26_10100 [Stenomitos sp.]